MGDNCAPTFSKSTVNSYHYYIYTFILRAVDAMLHRDLLERAGVPLGVQVASFCQLYNYMSMEMQKCSKK